MKAIIFDFDGTLADSFDMFVETLTHLTKRTQPLPPDEIKQLRRGTIKDAMRRLHIRAWQIPIMLVRGRRHIGRHIDKIDAFPGIPELIRELSQDYDLYILSTNSEPNIIKFLQKYHLRPLFPKIYSGVGLGGKARALRSLIKREHLYAPDSVYVGDEVRDIKAAHAAGLKCIYVSWGYTHHESLGSTRPDAIAYKPSDLPGLIAIQD